MWWFHFFVLCGLRTGPRGMARVASSAQQAIAATRAITAPLDPVPLPAPTSFPAHSDLEIERAGRLALRGANRSPIEPALVISLGEAPCSWKLRRAPGRAPRGARVEVGRDPRPPISTESDLTDGPARGEPTVGREGGVPVALVTGGRAPPTCMHSADADAVSGAHGFSCAERVSGGLTAVAS